MHTFFLFIIKLGVIVPLIDCFEDKNDFVMTLKNFICTRVSKSTLSALFFLQNYCISHVSSTELFIENCYSFLSILTFYSLTHSCTHFVFVESIISKIVLNPYHLCRIDTFISLSAKLVSKGQESEPFNGGFKNRNTIYLHR